MKKIGLLDRKETVIVDDDEYMALKGSRWARLNDGYVHRVRPNGNPGARLDVILAGVRCRHLNEDKSDFRKENLIPVGSSDQRTSRYVGVSKDSARGTWTASARINGKQIRQVGFATEEAARLARKALMTLKKVGAKCE